MPSESSPSTVEHYEKLLSRVYTWMIGGLSPAIRRNLDFFAEHAIENVTPATARALDIGAGPGPQSLALAELGYAVTAIDPSEALLEELRDEAACRGLSVQALRDAVPLEDRHPGPFDLVTCMTDTLTSLPAIDTARGFISEAAERLKPGGRLVLTWRDLTRLPEGDARFLAVRSDPDRILSCFLEALDEDRVRVHDLLFERTAEGFSQRVSSYAKLRLSAEVVDQWLTDAKLLVETQGMASGLLVRVARRPA